MQFLTLSSLVSAKTSISSVISYIKMQKITNEVTKR